jgi:ribulose-phosphate 3-epimerase
MVHHVLVMSVNPGFGGQRFLPRSVERIAALRRLRHEMGLNFRIEVDGGIAEDTVGAVVQAGAEMLVAGSAIFDREGEREGEGGRAEENAREFLRVARAAADISV